MDYEKISKRFVRKLSSRLHVTINPYIEQELIGEVLSLMKTAAQYRVQQIGGTCPEHGAKYQLYCPVVGCKEPTANR